MEISPPHNGKSKVEGGPDEQDILAQKRATEGKTNSQKREGRSPLIVQITSENEHLVSRAHKGLIINLNGTMVRTPQYETWCKHNNIQLKLVYESVPTMPEGITEIYHPLPSYLNIDWTHDGEWVIIPSNNKEVGPDYENYRLGRIERYIDTDGRIRKALSYGNEDIKLTVWFDLEKVLDAYPNWKIPQPGVYYNRKKFNLEAKRTAKTERNPGDQPQGIQGKKQTQNRVCPSYSPIGFWPIPRMEPFFKNHSSPWVVPKERNPRGNKRSLFYFDTTEGNILFTRNEVLETRNRFSLLEDNQEDIQEDSLQVAPSRRKKPLENKQEEPPDDSLSHARGVHSA